MFVVAGRAVRLVRHHGFEAAPNHALGVKRHGFVASHELDHERVLHHGSIDLIAVPARFVFDPREPNDFGFLQLHAARKRRDFAHRNIVGDALVIAHGSTRHPDLAGFARDLFIIGNFVFGNRKHKSVDVGRHGEDRSTRTPHHGHHHA